MHCTKMGSRKTDCGKTRNERGNRPKFSRGSEGAGENLRLKCSSHWMGKQCNYKNPRRIQLLVSMGLFLCLYLKNNPRSIYWVKAIGITCTEPAIAYTYQERAVHSHVTPMKESKRSQETQQNKFIR
jgi:hypothetical protein